MWSAGAGEWGIAEYEMELVVALVGPVLCHWSRECGALRNSAVLLRSGWLGMAVLWPEYRDNGYIEAVVEVGKVGRTYI